MTNFLKEYIKNFNDSESLYSACNDFFYFFETEIEYMQIQRNKLVKWLDDNFNKFKTAILDLANEIDNVSFLKNGYEWYKDKLRGYKVSYSFAIKELIDIVKPLIEQYENLSDKDKEIGLNNNIWYNQVSDSYRI